MSSTNYKALIQTSILDEKNFVKATFKGQQRGEYVPWQEVVIRPVLIKDERHLQFSYFESNKNIVKNYNADDVAEKLTQLLAQPFKNYKVENSAGNFHVQITKKGRAIVHHSNASSTEKLDLSHNRRKAHLITKETSDAFLKAVGIMTGNGQIKANMQRKLHQINDFLRLIEDKLDAEALRKNEPIKVVDFGCGNAYLTFATYHYLNHLLQVKTHLTGVDVKADLMQRHLNNSQGLGWQHLNFVPTTIIDYEAETPADIVIALHACDTATDEALAQGIGWQSDYIFSAPCCHQHLQQQLRQQPSPTEFKPILRHGILRERWGDILTDTFRATILRMMGYRTEVIEFVSSEHTAKNLMIRAVRTSAPGQTEAIEEYKTLKSQWNVTPFLETLLGDQVTQFL